MDKNLVIVESPAKAKTIGKFLGKNYVVKASVGHVRDLPKSKLGIDIDNNFEPYYITIRGKGDIIKELKKATKKSKKVLLATDPDREGEAISWHLAELLKLDKNEKIRIEFNEITKNAIKNAVKNPRVINSDLIDAQQARRILDRLVGYKISPLLWNKIEKGLSAGRVQSIAVKLICDKEKEINAFKPEEYWTIEITIKKDNNEFVAKYYGTLVNNKIKKEKIANKEIADQILDKIKENKVNVHDIEKLRRKKSPYAPFTTSSLQQEANKKLGYSSKKTMMIAQQLYEGINIKGEGSVGLITYIRTDSYRISNEALSSLNEYIKDNIGEKYLKNRVFKKKGKAEIQDAHEAIRPTSIYREPEVIKNSLSNDQFKLYNLIWQRFTASQMADAEYDVTNIIFNCENKIFKTSGSIIVFDGFKKIYKYTDDQKDKQLPNLVIQEELKIKDKNAEQHFTKPPARYSEATLVKTMEELGIGRPSTYAPTISTILNREYVIKEKNYFSPTDLGFLVTETLEKYFSNVINEKFTAEMEKQLDQVSRGEIDWHNTLEEFYGKFKYDLANAEEKMEKIEIKEEVSEEKCDKCGAYMVVKKGRFGKFLACPNYPECKNTKPLKSKDQVEETDIKCEKCGAVMLKRRGKYGEFLACSNYPQCKNSKQIIKGTGVSCPECASEIVEKYSKKGRKFYGCSGYPKCNFMLWYEPTNKKCDICGSMLIKKKGDLVCSNKNCK